jgi:hypothetical protein
MNTKGKYGTFRLIDIMPGEPETPEDGRTKIGGEKDEI